MPQGAGEYAKECGEVMETTHAECVVVIVVGGARGNGFSMQTKSPQSADFVIGTLRHVANQIEADVAEYNRGRMTTEISGLKFH